MREYEKKYESGDCKQVYSKTISRFLVYSFTRVTARTLHQKGFRYKA